MINKREIQRSAQFKKDLKLSAKQGKDLTLANQIITMLANDILLPAKHRDHALTGNWTGYRECHITPDLLLVYRKTDNNRLLLLLLARIASHSDLDF